MKDVKPPSIYISSEGFIGEDQGLDFLGVVSHTEKI